MNNTAIILTANATGLAVIRSLHKVGVDCIILSKTDDVCLKSKLVHKKHLLSDNNWEYDILNILSDYEGEGCVLIPTSDLHLEFISKHFHVLNKNFKVATTDLKTLEVFTDKSLESELIQSLDIPSPKTLFKVVENKLNDFQLPIIFKPRTSSNNVLGVKNIIVNTGAELSEFKSKFKGKIQHVIAQEVIPGGESDLWITSCTFNKGIMVSFFCYQRISAAPKLYGVTSFAVSKFNKQLFELSEIIGQRLNYDGNADIEFKWDYRDETFKYIELNSRIGMCGWFDTRCGVNNIANSFYIFNDQPEKVVAKQQKEGLMLLSFYEDVYSRLKSNENILKVLFTYIKVINKIKVSLFFAIRDPSPGVFVYSTHLKNTLNSIINKCIGKLKA